MRNKLFFLFGLLSMLWAMLSVHDNTAFLLGFAIAFIVPFISSGMVASYKAKKTGQDQQPDYVGYVTPSIIAAAIMWAICLIMHWHC